MRIALRTQRLRVELARINPQAAVHETRFAAPTAADPDQVRPVRDHPTWTAASTAPDNRRPPGNREGAVKLGYFHNGHFPPIEFEEFVRWGAANGYQAVDVPLFEPNVRADL